MAVLNANLTVVYLKTQATIGTPKAIDTSVDSALRVVSIDIKPRGEAQIQRTDLKSPYGIAQPPVVGSLGWTIEMTTEGYLYPHANANAGPLAPLWTSCGEITFAVFDGVRYLQWAPHAEATLGADGVMPFTIEAHEIGGNLYSGFDALAVPTEIKAEKGGRVMVTWSIHASVGDLPSASTLTQADVTAWDELPLVGRGLGVETGDVTLPEGTAIESVTIRPGLELVERPSVVAVRGLAPSWVKVGQPQIDLVIDASPESDNPLWDLSLVDSVKTYPFRATIPATDGTANTGMSAAFDACYIMPPESAGDTFRQNKVTFCGVDSGPASLIIQFTTPVPA